MYNRSLSQHNLLFHHPATGLNHKNVRTLAVSGQERFAAVALLLCHGYSVAVVEGRRVLSNVISTQIAEHRIYGGVVPEIASRRHPEAISQVCDQAVEQAGISYKDIEAIAVTFAPGLIGALLVGVNYAKGLSFATGKPLVPVHHLNNPSHHRLYTHFALFAVWRTSLHNYE